MDKEAFIGMFGIRDKKLAASMPVQNESGLWQAWLMPDGGYMTQALDHNHRPWGNAYFLEKEDFHSLLSPVFPSFGSGGGLRSSKVRSDAPELLDRWYEQSVAGKAPQNPEENIPAPATVEAPPARNPSPAPRPEVRMPRPQAAPRPEDRIPHSQTTSRPEAPTSRPQAAPRPVPPASGHEAASGPKSTAAPIAGSETFSRPKPEEARLTPPTLQPAKPRPTSAQRPQAPQRQQAPKPEKTPAASPKPTKISASLWRPDKEPQLPKQPPVISPATVAPATVTSTVIRGQTPLRSNNPAPATRSTQKRPVPVSPELRNSEPSHDNRRPEALKPVQQPPRVSLSAQPQKKEQPVIPPPQIVAKPNPGPFSQPRQTPRAPEPPKPAAAPPRRPEPQKISPFIARPGDDATVFEKDMRDDFETLIRLAGSNMNIHLGRELEEELEKLLLREAPFSQKQKYMYSEFGLALRRIGKHQLALLAHQRALLLSPDDENILFNIARAEYELGMVEEAKASLRTALKKSPGFAPASKFLEFLTGQKA